jgi:hypothetical protein
MNKPMPVPRVKPRQTNTAIALPSKASTAGPFPSAKPAIRYGAVIEVRADGGQYAA